MITIDLRTIYGEMAKLSKVDEYIDRIKKMPIEGEEGAHED